MCVDLCARAQTGFDSPVVRIFVGDFDAVRTALGESSADHHITVCVWQDGVLEIVVVTSFGVHVLHAPLAAVAAALTETADLLLVCACAAHTPHNCCCNAVTARARACVCVYVCVLLALLARRSSRAAVCKWGPPCERALGHWNVYFIMT